MSNLYKRESSNLFYGFNYVEIIDQECLPDEGFNKFKRDGITAFIILDGNEEEMSDSNVIVHSNGRFVWYSTDRNLYSKIEPLCLKCGIAAPRQICDWLGVHYAFGLKCWSCYND